MNKIIEQLKRTLVPYVQSIELMDICKNVLEDERFATFPASISKHHCWEGGLAEHTLQVLTQGIAIAKSCSQINTSVIAIAAVWHDYGKVYDYEKNSDGKWVYTLHRERIRHLPRSYAEWMHATHALPNYCEAFRNSVAHCILSHHGSLNAGSPVLPQTKEAWAVHLADMISVNCIESRKA